MGRQIVYTLPELEIGGVYDLSYRAGGLPNRIHVETVFRREQDMGWMYSVMMESTGERTNLTEDFIRDRLCHKDGRVYQMPDIRRRYSEGYRWCGNFPKNDATNQAKLIAKNDNIQHVKLYPAINAGGTISKNQHGIWIKWFTTIDDNGMINICDDCDCIKIK